MWLAVTVKLPLPPEIVPLELVPSPQLMVAAYSFADGAHGSLSVKVAVNEVAGEPATAPRLIIVGFVMGYGSMGIVTCCWPLLLSVTLLPDGMVTVAVPAGGASTVKFSIPKLTNALPFNVGPLLFCSVMLCPALER